MRRPAFSILELIIAVTVIGILASIVMANFGDVRVRARDANRRLAVTQYSTSMEQWKAAKGNYFIEDGDCEITDYNKLSGMSGSVPACVGYNGGSVGQMTRTFEAGVLERYKTFSIAQVLVEKGYLTRISADPLDRSFITKSTRDYILTICDNESNMAKTKTSAVQFAIYARLEKPKTSDETTAKQHCGGSETDGAWDVLIYTL